ncbi:hypothetical protein ABCR94_26795 [Streptomyces sp. 21So2-11]|uniref:hypothetical protein n=1 Tax=Streptomyces sp. 21So2-11 TaxID=3144408 RepID=UPI0032195E00
MKAAHEFDADVDFDLFMLTPGQLAQRALALADRCCRRASKTSGPSEMAAVRTAFRAVDLVLRLARRAETTACRDTVTRSIP